MIELKKPFEKLFARVGVDSVSDPVIFGEVFELVQFVTQLNSGTGVTGLVPAVSRKNCFVHFTVERAELEQALITSVGFFRLVADLSNEVGRKIRGVEKIVAVSQTEPEAGHKGTPVFMIAFTDRCQRDIHGSPEPIWKGECFETVGW